jgi:hypothetical protein
MTANTPRCCPDTKRRHGLTTRAGLLVYDLHHHERGWRGYTLQRGQKIYCEWFANGRVTPLAATDADLMLGGS